MRNRKDMEFEKAVDDLLYILENVGKVDGMALNWMVIETLRPWVGKVSKYGIDLDKVIDYLSSKESDMDSTRAVVVLEDIQSRY